MSYKTEMLKRADCSAMLARQVAKELGMSYAEVREVVEAQASFTLKAAALKQDVRWAGLGLFKYVEKMAAKKAARKQNKQNNAEDEL